MREVIKCLWYRFWRGVIERLRRIASGAKLLKGYGVSLSVAN